MMLGCRNFLVAAGDAAAGLLGRMPGEIRAEARAALSEIQAPGRYRVSLGQSQITIVSEDTMDQHASQSTMRPFERVAQASDQIYKDGSA